MGDKSIVIFIKNPELGKVKTRLAKSLGDKKALTVYKQLLNYTRKLCAEFPASRLLFYSNFIDENDDWPKDVFQKHKQEGSDLGERMLHAFQFALSKHSKTIIIGSDCAELTTAHLETAFNELEHHDFVIGPAKDGGYYLLGMKTAEERLFRDKIWSTENVFEQTIQDIKMLDKSYFTLPNLRDTDYLEDWEKIKDRLEGL